jgi:hypothetical protein
MLRRIYAFLLCALIEHRLASIMQDHATQSKKWVRDVFAAVNIEYAHIPGDEGRFGGSRVSTLFGLI